MSYPTPLDLALDHLNDAMDWLQEYDTTREEDALNMALNKLAQANALLDKIAGGLE